MDCPDANSVFKKELKGKEYVIDIPPDLEPAQWPECCIYRVPKKLRSVNECAYTPKLISIGPFHHGNEDLREMEKQKLRYFKDFCSKNNRSQEELASIVEGKELQIRHSYAEAPKQGKNQFVKMILLDAIFIIELVVRNYETPEEEQDDHILVKPWLRNAIQLDLILLENQLPFFILDDLYKFVFNANKTYVPFRKLCRNYFSCYYFSCYEKKQQNSNSRGEVKHFTDLVRNFYIADKLDPPGKIRHLYCATKLDEAGVKFKAVQPERSLLGIQIKKPNHSEICSRYCSWLLDPCLKYFEGLKLMQTTLEIPQFVINHGTELIFRNIMALEECHYPSQAYICNYIALLNFLIVTSDDVELLVYKKIIVHSLVSNEEVAKMVNKLGKEIGERNSCYFCLAEYLLGHCEYWWNKNIVSFKTYILRDFWRGTTTFLGIMVMLATIGSFFTPFVYHK